MKTVNHLSNGEGTSELVFTLGALPGNVAQEDAEYVERVKNYIISYEKFVTLQEVVKTITVSERFKDVIKTFHVPENETPAGFRIECELLGDGVLMVDLVRDISYDKNGVKRATKVLFSADSANPYEVAAIAPLLANLTCNPGIIYDLFINNPEANVGHKFNTRDEVMEEIGRILGPGCDISVELNNPFERDFDEILKECEKFKKMLSEYRLVIKVPHTGPVNAENVHELLEGDKKFSLRYDQGTTEDALRGHNLALKLREHGYRVNYTLMFEPYQTAFALQAKPYFINSFIRHRLMQSSKLHEYLEQFKLTGNIQYLKDLRTYMINTDYLNKNETDRELLEVKAYAERILKYRKYEEEEGKDGLDGLRHNLRMLKNCNLPDTRLIVCSMEGDYNYPDIDKLTVDPEFADIIDRLVITAEPQYLARFTTTNQVVSYQRRFMNAANGEK